MGNVKSMPTRPNGEQPWRCEVCGGVMAYSQPISFGLVVELGKLFTDWHEEHCKPTGACAHPESEGGCQHCTTPVAGKEAPSA